MVTAKCKDGRSHNLPSDRLKMENCKTGNNSLYLYQILEKQEQLKLKKPFDLYLLHFAVNQNKIYRTHFWSLFIYNVRQQT